MILGKNVSHPIAILVLIYDHNCVAVPRDPSVRIKELTVLAIVEIRHPAS